MAGFSVNIEDLVSLSKDFGEEGIRTTLGLIAAAVTVSTENAASSLRACLKRNWPKSSVSRKVQTQTQVTNTGVIGIVALRHDWVGPLALGENVPKHVILGKPTLAIKVNTKKEPNNVDIKSLSKDRVRLFKEKVDHPGYKGTDCVTPAERRGSRKLQQSIDKIALKLAQKLSGR